MTDDRWALRFPDLFAPWRVGYGDVEARLTTGQVPDSLVSRVHLVAVTASGAVVVCETVQGWRFLPGGTREPGEDLQPLAERELLEEAGARAVGSMEIFAAHRARDRAPRPYRPHLPHPVSYWAYAAVPVVLVGPPECPLGAEQITAVLDLDPSAAAEFLRGGVGEDNRSHVDLVLLADALGLVDLMRRRHAGA